MSPSRKNPPLLFAILIIFVGGVSHQTLHAGDSCLQQRVPGIENFSSTEGLPSFLLSEVGEAKCSSKTVPPDKSETSLPTLFQLAEIKLNLGRSKEAMKYIEEVLAHPYIFMYPSLAYTANLAMADSLYRRGASKKSYDYYDAAKVYIEVGAIEERKLIFKRLLERDHANLDYKGLSIHYKALSEIEDNPRYRPAFLAFTYLYDPLVLDNFEEELNSLKGGRYLDPAYTFVEVSKYHRAGNIPRSVTLLEDVLTNPVWKVHALWGIWRLIEERGTEQEKIHWSRILIHHLIGEGYYRKAYDVFKKSGDHSLSGSDHHFWVGLLHLENGDRETGEKHYLAYLNGPFCQDDLLLRIARYFYSVSNLSPSIASISKLVERYPKNIRHLNYLAFLHRMNGDYSEAIRVLEQAMESSPRDRQTLYEFAVSQHLREDYRATKEAFHRLIALYPLSGRYYNYLGYLMAEKNIDLNDSERLIKKALEFNPESEAYLDSYAWVKYQKKEYHAAEEYIQKALFQMKETQGQDAILYFHAGEIYHALGKTAEAKKYWQMSIINGYEDRKTIEARLNALKE